MIDLLPCPFCGGYAEFERMGGPRHSCVVAYTDCGCRLESNEMHPNSGKAWNTRVAPKGKISPGPLTPGDFLK